MSDNPKAGTILAAEQQTLNDLWEEHVRDEFAARDIRGDAAHDGAGRLCQSRSRNDGRRRT